jgi:hypothetical protein
MRFNATEPPSSIAAGIVSPAALHSSQGRLRSAAADAYSPSFFFRWARVLRRSALSLMKPAASR